MKKAALIILTALATFSTAGAKQTSNVLDIKESIEDNAIIYPESFERDSRKLLEGWYMKNYTATDERYKNVDDANVSDDQIIKRLQSLPTVIEMPFNQIVRQYIERYTKYGRPQVAAILGLSHYYMPIFEQALEAQRLPLELKYLPVIESGLDPNAVSRHGATGLWQFMLGAAKGLGLEVNSLVDERRDPYLSSETAAAFLKDLYATYGDWSLAIAAYNCGPGAVNKAIRRAGGDPGKQDFWSIYKYLPAETRGYVPMFIAANYVMNFYPEHNISPVVVTKPLVTDTVCVNTRIHFNQISKVLDIPLEELRILNPQFRTDLIPGSQENPYYLILPSQQVHAYIMSENDIRNYEAEKYIRRATANPGDINDFVAQVKEENISGAASTAADTEIEEEVAQVKSGEASRSAGRVTPGTTIVHKVVPGESLATIADKYGVSPVDIKSWNNLRRNAVRTGQQLRIQTAAGSQPAATKATKATRTETAQSSAKATKVNARKNVPETQAEQATTYSGKKGKLSRRDKKAEEATAYSKSKKSKKSKKEKAKNVSHKVKKGENLTVIAKRNGVSVEELKKANNLSGDNLREGKILKIPSKNATKSKKSKSSKKSKKRKK